MIKFNDVTLIDNYRMINETIHFIKANISFDEGSIHLIKGDNSKYLIGKLLMGFILPSFGKIDINKYSITHNSNLKIFNNIRQIIGYLPYNFDIKFNYHTVNNNLKEILYNYNYDVKQADKKCEEVLEKVGLFGDYKKAQIKDLNSINKYRLYLASILIHNPDIILVERYINDPDIKNTLINLAHNEKKIVIIVGNYNINVDREYIVNNNEFKEVLHEKQ